MPAPVLFLAFAQDPARFLPRLADELRGVRDTLEQAEKQGLCKLVLRGSATLDEIFQVFQDNGHRDRIALFHFAGHGDATGLLLETPAAARTGPTRGVWRRSWGNSATCKQSSSTPAPPNNTRKACWTAACPA